MNTAQLQQLGHLTTRTRQIVAQLRAITRGTEALQGELAGTLEQLEEDVADLTNRVQERHARIWLSTHPPQPALPLSTEVNHGVHVRRHTAAGIPCTEAHAAPPALSGKWQIGRLGEPKPRTSSALSTVPALLENR